METPDIRAVVAVIELVASEQGVLTPWLLDMLSNSPVRYAILNLATDWQTGDIAGLAAVAQKAAQDLDRLERRRHWSHPRQVVTEPHLPALYSFARLRNERIRKGGRKKRLEIIGRTLGRLYGRERQKRKIEAFLSEPDGPVDTHWLRNFLRHPSEGS